MSTYYVCIYTCYTYGDIHLSSLNIIDKRSRGYLTVSPFLIQGKSHTMLGTPEAGHTLGAIPCAITWLFRGISEQRQRTGARFSVRVSCVELTTGQQQLRDLLAAHANGE